MSDDEDDDKGKPGKRSKDKVLVEPVVSDEELWRWLESLFYSVPEVAHFPEKLELRIIKGKQLEIYGPRVKQKIFAPASASEETRKKMPGALGKPTREELVHLSNTLMQAMRQECDVQAKPTAFGIFVWHMSRGDEPYERFVRRMRPEGRYTERASDSQGVNDEEQTAEKLFSTQILKHQESMVGMLGAGFEGQIDRMSRELERAYARIAHLETTLETKNDQLERALSSRADRDEKAQWTALKIKASEKGLDLVTSWGPPLLNQLAGKMVVPTTETAETLTLKSFFKSMTSEQMDAVVGVYSSTEPYDLVKPGILSFEQAKLLIDIAEGRVSADKLDLVMPGGSMEISMQQVMALGQCGIGMEQLAPLQIIFQSRQQRRGPQPPQPQT